ncbi:type II-A CRISPR-associated protein Csn2 [Blautia glucerasea]|uniref:type II-A CRISPR-associated protein Csn2 n=1 Tax=Blautia glucerasea TaxID=536633 RepID=UPI001D014C8B|nr:type II-A CRISPR-associated protein Csn2 [Blautia glucerasea]MCB5387572.1 type II-A CRISPR-associated protein Csn2 [Blautia glucerasea]MCB5421909.1 type II-A CRISPR-associated protein Csn2 [Blautia luti]
MKLVHTELTGEILKEGKEFSEWIIESPALFSGYLQELYGQCEKREGRFVLSDRDKEVDLAREVEIITDPFAVDLNGRKILNKLYAELGEVSRAEEMYTKTLELTQRIQEYILQLEENTNHILQFNDEMDISGLLKMMDVKIEDSEDFFFERLCSYIKNAVNVLGVRLFAFVNLRSYLTDEQMQELIKEIIYQEIQALFIENQERTCLKGGMRYIIDKDYCEIF